MKLARLAALLALPLAAPAAAQPAQKPKLVVVISVDQFSADLFAQYRQHFDGGLERLSEGVVFPAGYQGHNATETCPGHSTILTGSRPARTGIIANNWFNLGLARDDKGVYCSEDPRVPGSSSKGGQYTVSSYHLRVPALGDHMKRADPRSRVAVVSGKDRAAIMMGGYGPDQRWWWDHDAKAFVNPRAPSTPRAVSEANEGVTEGLSRPRPARDLPKICEAHDRAVPVEGGGKPVGTWRFDRPAGDKNMFRASPDFDRATLDLGEALRREMKLGEGEATDLLILGLSATDYVGHTFGTQGAEMCIQLMALDEALGGFFRNLDSTGIDYLVTLTADHGGVDIPERARDQAASDAIAGRSGAQRRQHGQGARPEAEAERRRPLRRRRLRRHVSRPQADRDPAHPAAPRGGGDLPAPSPGRRGVHQGRAGGGARPVRPARHVEPAPARQGELRPRALGRFRRASEARVTPIFDTSRGYVATHGSPWDYDRRVPILFWRKGLAPFEQPLAVETADILPTLAAVLGVPIAPGTIDGRCLDLDEGPGSSCGR